MAKNMTTTQKQNLQTFITLQKKLQKVDSEFPLQYSICLAEIALCPGLSLTDLADKTAMPLSTVSRIVGALSKHRQRGKPYELVTVTVSPQERRRKQLSLTKRGESLVNDLGKTLSETIKPARIEAA